MSKTTVFLSAVLEVYVFSTVVLKAVSVIFPDYYRGNDLMLHQG